MIKSKSDLTSQLMFEKTDFKHISSESSSKGNVTKYTDGKLWLKTNYLGYEALAEVISSRVIKSLGFDTVEYRPCFITRNEYEVESACVSDSFTIDVTEYCVGRALQCFGGYSSSDDMFNAFMRNPDAVSRIQWVLQLLKPLGITDSFQYPLAELLWIDSILLNEDRHLFNLVLTKDQLGAFRLINFDYGASLLSDLRDYPMAMPLRKAISCVKSKPFSRKFSIQLRALQKYLPQMSTHTVLLDISDLFEYYELENIERCIRVLAITLQHNDITLNVVRDNEGRTSIFGS